MTVVYFSEKKKSAQTHNVIFWLKDLNKYIQTKYISPS